MPKKTRSDNPLGDIQNEIRTAFIDQRIAAIRGTIDLLETQALALEKLKTESQATEYWVLELTDAVEAVLHTEACAVVMTAKSNLGENGKLKTESQLQGPFATVGLATSSAGHSQLAVRRCALCLVDI